MLDEVANREADGDDDDVIKLGFKDVSWVWFRIKHNIKFLLQSHEISITGRL
jgi:hypothetical protein